MTTAGKKAVCYCDRLCNSPENWAVVASFVWAGPRGSQNGVVTQGLLTEITVEGYGLHKENRIYLMLNSQECKDQVITDVDSGETISIDWVNAPADVDAEMNANENKGAIKNIVATSEGLKIEFGPADGRHNLQTGDSIDIQGVVMNMKIENGDTTERLLEVEKMINGMHHVTVICDVEDPNYDPAKPTETSACHSVLLDVHFDLATFNAFVFNRDQTTWVEEKFGTKFSGIY